VYLPNVLVAKRKADEPLSDCLWEQAFRASRWFTRGWTLQELLAPSVVEFFSKDRKRLGDKNSLERWIHEITGVPLLALKGTRLSRFTVDERFLWAERRQTTVPEDKVYSLLGIFDVQIPLYYGKESAEGAHRRLQEVIDKREKCMQDLCITNPRSDKTRLMATKGGLLAESCRWAFEKREYQEWRNGKQNGLLWIKGDPGKGKTMLMCGIIDELETSAASSALISYFFCEATDRRINSATSVLRGLIYMLVEQQPSLVSHVRKRYDIEGKKVFEDANAWHALSDMLRDILEDANLADTYIILDALDECVEDMPDLLSLIVKRPTTSQRVKWLVSSRNWPDIEGRLGRTEHKTSLSLELNAVAVSEGVNIYIRHKVDQLARLHSYDPDTKKVVLEQLSQKAEGTFLWVALVCQSLKDVKRWDVLETLEDFPTGLNSLYERMMEQVGKSKSAKFCKLVLATMTTVYRPVTMAELLTFLDVPDAYNDMEAIAHLIGLCASFLTVRDNTIYFVHQSAQDYLMKTSDGDHQNILHSVKYTLVEKTIHTLASTLRRDIYQLGEFGYPVMEVRTPCPDPLATARYACVYWIEHLCDWLSQPPLDRNKDIGYVSRILGEFMRKKYLYWLEALSLCGSIPEGVVSLGRLSPLVQVCSTRLHYHAYFS
jgi:hypothetical protein